MGATASADAYIPSDLTSEERSEISRAVQRKFDSLSKPAGVDSGSGEASESPVAAAADGEEVASSSLAEVKGDAELFAALREELERVTQKVVNERKGEQTGAPEEAQTEAQTQDKEEEVEGHGRAPTPNEHMIGNVVIEVDRTVSADQGGEGEDRDKVFFSENEQPHEIEKRVFHQSSHDMLSAAAESMLEDQNIINNFISQLKDGEMNSPQTSEFRARRLTFAKSHAPGEEMTETSAFGTSDLIASQPSTSPKASFISSSPPKARTFAKKRTTIFASAEIGVRQKATLPFPTEVFGTFSCHGIEPGDDEGDEDGIHQKDNQDRGCCVHPFKNHPKEALFMVLDGHGPQGDAVSEFAMRQIVVSLERSPAMQSDPEEALKDAFIKTNAALMVTPIEYMTSGTTCVAVYMRETHYWIAHVGDSRCVCAVQEGDKLVAHDACQDHKPDNPEERARIEAWGGFVSPPPEEGMSARVWLDEDMTMIGLAMARSIGDYAVKAVGVIPEPEVNQYDIGENHKFMILASDGVWEFISSQEAVDIVQENIHLGADMACEYLIHQATERWAEEEGDYRDDITAIVITFPLPWGYNS